MEKRTKVEEFEYIKGLVSTYDPFFFDRVHEVAIYEDDVKGGFSLIYNKQNPNRHSFSKNKRFGVKSEQKRVNVKTLRQAEELAYSNLNTELYRIDRNFCRLKTKELLIIKHRLELVY